MVLCDQMLSDLFLNYIFWKLINSIFQAIPVLTLHTQNKQSEISKWILTVCHQHVTFASSGTFSPFLSPFLSVHLFCYHPPSPCYSLSNPLPPSLVPHPPSMLALTHYELLAALMYGQYSLYHISTAEVCKGRDRKRRREGKESEREKMGRRHICSTHLSAKRYNYLSQHIIHVLYHPRAPCLCLAALTPCKAHILTLAMTVYLRKENCPQGDGE